MSNTYEGPFDGDMTLDEARDMLRELVDEGHTCPCCTQFAKVYRFGLNAAMAHALIRMWITNGTGWVEVPSLGLPGGHFAKLRFWSLIEKPPEVRREDGSSRVGIWRVTPTGVAFIKRTTTVLRYARIYNNRCLGLDGEDVDIATVLGKKFDYGELMAGV